ncbi:integrin alpha-PS1-like isoform X1 [Rhodnius prolixus]|uniref:integrin alpha-PS1-like isoform X1 n=1 Tax=Rhodnius prolixus TaxID=13249 RepID=UPI003D189FD6
MDLGFYFSLLVLTFCSTSFSFNFETRLPVIKKGGEGTYFGFSVAEHQFSEQNQNLLNNLLLVGAPLDQNRQPKTNKSGALWSCPITTLYYDCEQVVTDGKTDADGHYNASVGDKELVAPIDDEIKNGQWLGVTVRSEGTDGKVLVCAHRYINKKTDQESEHVHGRGLCYTLTNRLQHSGCIDPCKNRPTNRAHEQFGYCQAGTSGLITNDTLLVGSPGPYTWRGTIFVLSILDDFLSRDKTMYYSPLTEKTAPIDKYSYLGMSVAAGDFFGNGLAYAAGAPRSNGNGEVVIFTKVKAVTIMKPVMTLTGDMYTSNFGYDMTTADVNGDKRVDLIVGAPNYFDKNEGGAIYIYLNLNNDCSLKCLPPIKLTGQPESRYGIAITNLGDINKDGYEDIAVGAPYEDLGKVYIYLGSRNGTITEPSQIILGSDYNLETFGYSLSGGLDMDNNGYPDLLIGAFESSSVVLLRTRPIIELTTTVGPETALTGIDPNKNGCPVDPHSNLTCFTFETCVSVQAVMKLVAAGTGLRMNYTLRADVYRRIPRVFIGPQFNVKPHIMHKVIYLRQDRGELKHCHSDTVYIKDDTRDIQTAVAMRLSYTMLQDVPVPPKPGDPLPRMDNFPILDQQQADRVVRATFLKDCGENDICESQLTVDASLDLPLSKPGGNKWDLILGELKEFLLNVTVHNLQESAYESYLVIKHSPSVSYIAQLKGKSHSCEKGSEVDVVCSLGNPFERNAEVNIVLRFEPLISIDEVNEVQFDLSANTTSQLVESDPSKTLIAKVVRKAKLTIRGSARPEEVIYGGEVRGESMMKYKDQPGSRIKHVYEVYNNGPWHVSGLGVHVDWPFQVANNKPIGKWLLYLDEEPTADAEEGGACYTHTDQVNPLKLLERGQFLGGTDNNGNTSAGSQYARLRRKREVEMIVRKDSDNIVRMNCKAGTAKCIKFHCVFYKLSASQSATLTIKARLWNSTLVEDYSRVKAAEIASNAKIYVHAPGLVITSEPNEIEARAVTVAKVGGFPEQQVTDGVELWIILVGVVAGLILLLLIVLLLWKCGFFKRTRPYPTLSGNLEKRNDD